MKFYRITLNVESFETEELSSATGANVVRMDGVTYITGTLFRQLNGNQMVTYFPCQAQLPGTKTLLYDIRQRQVRYRIEKDVKKFGRGDKSFFAHSRNVAIYKWLLAVR